MDLMTILFGLHVVANVFGEYENDCGCEDDYDNYDFEEFDDYDDD